MLALGFVIIIGIFLHVQEYLYNYYNWKAIQRAEVNNNLDFYGTAQRRTFTKPFIYLTGTEQCLPANLATSSQIGDPNTCSCDVMVLSFRVQCRTPQDQSHISYLFDPNTGWRLGIGKKCALFCRNAEKTGLPLLHIP